MCFKCVEPYTLGHTCKQAHIHYIVVDEPVGSDNLLEGQGGKVEEFSDCPEGELSIENIEVSIHALAGEMSTKPSK